MSDTHENGERYEDGRTDDEQANEMSDRELEENIAPETIEAREEAEETAASPVTNDPMESVELLHVDRYEGAWMRITAAVLAIFFVSILISAFAVGFQLPGVYERVDPETLFDPDSPFAEPGLRELAPGRYELYIRAQIWRFTPEEVHVPLGSEVTIYTTSQDVLHGFKLQNTNINMMILPGQISQLTVTFDEPGRYNYVCHEYCGQQHHTMAGAIIVDPPEALAESTDAESTDTESVEEVSTEEELLEVSAEADGAEDTAETESMGEQENVAASEGETD